MAGRLPPQMTCVCSPRDLASMCSTAMGSRQLIGPMTSAVLEAGACHPRPGFLAAADQGVPSSSASDVLTPSIEGLQGLAGREMPSSLEDSILDILDGEVSFEDDSFHMEGGAGRPDKAGAGLYTLGFPGSNCKTHRPAAAEKRASSTAGPVQGEMATLHYADDGSDERRWQQCQGRGEIHSSRQAIFSLSLIGSS